MKTVLRATRRRVTSRAVFVPALPGRRPDRPLRLFEIFPAIGDTDRARDRHGIVVKLTHARDIAQGAPPDAGRQHALRLRDLYMPAVGRKSPQWDIRTVSAHFHTFPAAKDASAKSLFLFIFVSLLGERFNNAAARL